MVKILSQAGMSLADVYNVKGSIAGIDQLEAREVSLVHEMGGTLFSERFSTFIRTANSGAIAQSTGFVQTLTDLPSFPYKILAIRVFVDVLGRLVLASVAMKNAVNTPGNLREIPIWIWANAAGDGEIPARFSADGGAVGTVEFLQPSLANLSLPHLVAGRQQPQNVRDVVFRGFTGAFGAGTVTTTMLLLLGFSHVGGISSRGLPMPGW